MRISQHLVEGDTMLSRRKEGLSDRLSQRYAEIRNVLKVNLVVLFQTTLASNRRGFNHLQWDCDDVDVVFHCQYKNQWSGK